MKIPIRNLYYLLLYAWDVLDIAETVQVSDVPSEHTLDLLAFVLSHATERLMKRGLDREFLETKVQSTAVRGSIDFAESVASGAVMRRQLTCTTDELSSHVLQNKIIKSTINRLVASENLHSEIRGDLRRLHSRLEGMSEARLSPGIFARVKLHRNNRDYQVLMSVCRLVYENCGIDSATGNVAFFDFTQDEKKMRVLFEAFVRNFLRRKLQGDALVGARQCEWHDKRGSPDVLEFLPTLNMDVIIDRGHRIQVIDTKFTDKIFTEWRGKQRFRTSHLYQLFSYVENLSGHRPKSSISGMLLYPQVGSETSMRFSMKGRQYHVASLNLNDHWQAIENRLLALSA